MSHFFKLLLLFCAYNIITSASIPDGELKNDVDSGDENEVEDIIPISGLKFASHGAVYNPLRKNIFVVPGYDRKLSYRVGSRRPADMLVGRGSQNNSWTTPRDVGITIRYPPTGLGSMITYIECDVDQLTDQGRMYVTSGGIGLHYVQFVIEAYNTTFANFACNIYGMPQFYGN